MLEKCIRKCRSMAVAVPCAIFYTHEQYAALCSCKISNAPTTVRLTEAIKGELLAWLDIELGENNALKNGVKWFKPEHYILETGELVH